MAQAEQGVRGDLIRKHGSLEAAAAAFRRQGRGLGTAEHVDFEALIRSIYTAFRPRQLAKLPALLVKYEDRPGGLAEMCALVIERFIIRGDDVAMGGGG